MNYPVNQRINTYPQSSTGLSLSQLQEINGDTIKNGVAQNELIKSVSEDSDKTPWLAPVLSLPVWASMVYGMNKFNTACGGQYEQSLPYRMVKSVDNFVKKYEFLDKMSNKIVSGFKSATTFLDKRFVSQSKILTAFFKTPSEPKFIMVKMMSKGTIAEVSSEAIKQLEAFKVKDPANLLKMGVSEAELQELVANPHVEKNIQKIIQLCEKLSTNIMPASDKVIKLPFTKGQKYLSDFIPGLGTALKKDIVFSEYANKMKTLQGVQATTVLGKSVPKLIMRIIESVTNGTAGGKFAIFMAAYFIADSIKDAIHAPKDDKVKKFAESNISGMAFYLTMPFVIGLLHKFGGLQYIGVDPEKVEHYRTALNEFNNKVNSGAIKVKSIYLAEEAKILALKKQLLKPATAIQKSDKLGTKIIKAFKNIVYKPLSLGAKGLTTGLECTAAFNPEGVNKSSGMGVKVKQFFTNGKFKGTKGFLGALIRFGVFAAFFAPTLGKLGAKFSHLIFGRPSKSILDEEPEVKEGEQPKQAAVATPTTSTTPMKATPPPPTAPVQQAQIQPSLLMQPIKQNNGNLISNQTAPAQRENLVDMYQGSPNASKSMMASQEPVRTYVPSSERVNIQPTAADEEKNNKMNTALNKAHNAELMANKFVGGKQH